MRKTFALLTAAVTLAGIVFLGMSQPAGAIPGVCDFAPAGPLSDACHATVGAVTDPVGAVEGVAGLAGDGAAVAGVDISASGMVKGILDQFSAVLADTVKGAMEGLTSTLDSAPAPPVDQAWFDSQYRPVMATGVLLSFAVALWWFCWFGLRGHADELGRSFKLFLVAVFFSASAPIFIRVAVQGADALSAGFASWGGAQAGALNDKISEVTSGITVTGGLESAEWWAKPIFLVITLLAAVVLVLVWMVLLMVRSEIIYVGTLAIPFVLPAIIDGQMRFARIYFKALAGIILTKPILIGTLCSGAWLLRQGYVGQEGLWPILTGLAIIGAATFLPLVVLKLLVPAAAVAIAVVERAGTRVVAGAQSAATTAVGLVTGGAAGAGAAAAGGAWTASGEGPITVTRDAPSSPPPRPRESAPPPPAPPPVPEPVLEPVPA